jgi:hypothetical protein
VADVQLGVTRCVDGLGRALTEAVEAAAATGEAQHLRDVVAAPEMLFSWDRLNGALRAGELEWVHPHIEDGRPRYRLALFRAGKMIDPAQFFRALRSPRGAQTYRLDVEALTAELRTGGTFVVRDLDRHDDAVAAAAGALEERFDAPVMGGAFASWGDTTGFDLHWDAMDNVAVQVAGTRKWSLWRPAIPNPVEGLDMAHPEGPADLECVLEPGDALWFPRGWWHRPEGLGPPALHLTFGIYRRTGLDFVRWACERLCSLDLTRPWTDDVIDSFWADERARGLENRLSFTLPDVT